MRQNADSLSICGGYLHNIEEILDYSEILKRKIWNAQSQYGNGDNAKIGGDQGCSGQPYYSRKSGKDHSA